MTEVVLKPCPLCGDPMQLSGQLLRHVNQGDCLIGAQAWPSEWAERWNTALTGGVTQADVTPAMCEAGRFDVCMSDACDNKEPHEIGSADCTASQASGEGSDDKETA